MGALWRMLLRWMKRAKPVDGLAAGDEAAGVPAAVAVAAPFVQPQRPEPTTAVLELIQPSPLRPRSDFMLAARLSTVAKLNCPAGRKPRLAMRGQSQAAPAIPSARLGAKRSRQVQVDQRVLKICRGWHTAEIIAFPGPYRAPSIAAPATDLAA